MCITLWSEGVIHALTVAAKLALLRINSRAWASYPRINGRAAWRLTFASTGLEGRLL